MLTNHLPYLCDERRNHWHDNSCNGNFINQCSLQNAATISFGAHLGVRTSKHVLCVFSDHSISTPYSLSEDSGKQTSISGSKMKLSP